MNMSLVNAGNQCRMIFSLAPRPFILRRFSQFIFHALDLRNHVDVHKTSPRGINPKTL